MFGYANQHQGFRGECQRPHLGGIRNWDEYLESKKPFNCTRAISSTAALGQKRVFVSDWFEALKPFKADQWGYMTFIANWFVPLTVFNFPEIY